MIPYGMCLPIELSPTTVCQVENNRLGLSAIPTGCRRLLHQNAIAVSITRSEGKMPLRSVVLAALVMIGLAWYSLALLASMGTCRGLGSNLAPGLTRKGLLRLRVGMSETEVVSLIGLPLTKS